jgi:hypothetical protein
LIFSNILTLIFLLLGFVKGQTVFNPAKVAEFTKTKSVELVDSKLGCIIHCFSEGITNCNTFQYTENDLRSCVLGVISTAAAAVGDIDVSINACEQQRVRVEMRAREKRDIVEVRALHINVVYRFLQQWSSRERQERREWQQQQQQQQQILYRAFMNLTVITQIEPEPILFVKLPDTNCRK